MQSYQITFLGDGNEPPAGTNIILSPAERLFEGIHWQGTLILVQSAFRRSI